MMSTIRVKFVTKHGGEKNYFLLSYFGISFWLHPNFEFGDFLIQPIPTLHTSEVPTTPKNENFNKKMYTNIFYWNFHFLVSWISHKYAMWVWLGRRIKLCIQWVPKLEIWVNREGDMSKIRSRKITFFFFPSKVYNFLFYYYNSYFIISLWGPF